MKTSEPLTIENSTITKIKSLSRSAAENPEAERQLYLAITELSEQAQSNKLHPSLHLAVMAGLTNFH